MDTLDYYNLNAYDYFNNSLDADMSEVYKRFLFYLKENDLILDFGCGSGRDSKYFLDNGYNVDSVDGSLELCNLATKYLNKEVICMKFEDLDVVDKYYGVWACSSLLHVKKEELKNILVKIRNSLKLNGILYVSLKNGSGEEIINGRYFNYLTYKEFLDIIDDIGCFEELDFFQTGSSVNKDETKLWNNFILRKVEV